MLRVSFVIRSTEIHPVFLGLSSFHSSFNRVSYWPLVPRALAQNHMAGFETLYPAKGVQAVLNQERYLTSSYRAFLNPEGLFTQTAYKLAQIT